MIKATYEQLIERISHLSGKTIDEIKRLIEAKRAKLSGLISIEGAAQVVASELGISFEKQKFKIREMLIGMKKVSVIGKVLEVYPVKKYQRAGKENELATLYLADETSSIRVVLWDTKLIDKIKSGEISKGSVVEIKEADVRGTTARELHLSSSSSIEPSSAHIENVSTVEELPSKKIAELKPNERVSVKAYVVQLFQPTFFSVCPECSMRVSYENDKAVCVKHSTVIPKKRALLSMVIDDGSDNMRAIIFNEGIARLFKIEEGELDKIESVFLEKKQELMGSEILFSGRVRKNMLFDRNEFIIDACNELSPEQAIKELS